jgi:hypothetical protein
LTAIAIGASRRVSSTSAATHVGPEGKRPLTTAVATSRTSSGLPEIDHDPAQHEEIALQPPSAVHAVERRLGLAEARLVLALAEALPRSLDAIGLVLAGYCGRR